MAKLHTGTTPVLEISVTLRSGDADPTPGNTTLALNYYKDGHAKDGYYWTGSAWQAGDATFASAQSSQANSHAHRYVCPAGVLSAADMAGGRLILRAVAATVISSDKEWDIEPPGWLDDAVYISNASGSTNTTAPVGTRGLPAKNMTVATTIGTANGIRKYVFLDGDTYTLLQTYANSEFIGEVGATINMNGQTLGSSVFRNLALTGVGNPQAYDCILLNATFKGTFANRCSLVGACTIGDGTNPTFMVDCATVPFGGATTIALNDLVCFVRFGGEATFTSLTTGTVSLTQLEGIFTFDNTNTGGTINITGIIDLADNSGALCDVNLTDGALSITWINNGGPGLYQVVVHVRDGALAPIADVKVHVFDSTNAAPVWFGETNASGNATFNLKAGTYKIRFAKGTTAFTVPETMVVTKDETFNFTGTPFVAPTAVDPGDCAVYGTIWDSENKPWAGVQIDVYATTPQFVGDITMGKRLGTTHTSAIGEFTIDLGKGVEVRFVVEDAGIDFTKTVPNAANVDIKDWT